MSGKCTIFSPESNLELIEDIIPEISSRRFWKSSDGNYHIEFGKFSLKLYPSVRLERGDRISKIVGGAYSYFDRVQCVDPRHKTELLRQILRTHLLVGVQADPDFDPDEEMSEFVAELARELNGMIFTGDAFVDADDRLLLDSDGNFDPPEVDEDR